MENPGIVFLNLCGNPDDITIRFNNDADTRCRYYFWAKNLNIEGFAQL